MSNMKLPATPRDKLEQQYDLLTKYFDTIPPKSGKFKISSHISLLFLTNLGRMSQHVFRGTEPECYLKYKSFCKKQIPSPTDAQIIQTPRIFHEQRRAFHIGIEKGYYIDYILL